MEETHEYYYNSEAKHVENRLKFRKHLCAETVCST